MVKLSDSKFLRVAATQEVEATPFRLAPEVKANLREAALGSIVHRFDDNGLVPEMVSYVEPDSGLRRQGWLISAYQGLAKVEIADGAYAIVPEGELEYVSQKEKRSALREAVGHKATRSVRADLNFTRDLIPVNDTGDFSTTLSYRALSGLPSDDDVLRYVSSIYPDARVLEAEDRQPGKMGLVLHFEAGPEGMGQQLDRSQGDPRQVYTQPGLEGPELQTHNSELPSGTGAGFGYIDDGNRQAEVQEMGPAIGGELREVLAPAHDDRPTGMPSLAPTTLSSDEAKDALNDAEPRGEGPRKKQSQMQKKTRPVSEVADALIQNANSRDENMGQLFKALLVNAAERQAQQLASGSAPEEVKETLKAAIRLAPTKPDLWRRVSNFMTKAVDTTKAPSSSRPGLTNAPRTPGAPASPTSTGGEGMGAAPSGSAQPGAGPTTKALPPGGAPDSTKKLKDFLNQPGGPAGSASPPPTSLSTPTDQAGITKRLQELSNKETTTPLTPQEEAEFDDSQSKLDRKAVLRSAARDDGASPSHDDHGQIRPWPTLFAQDRRESGPDYPRPSPKEIFRKMNMKAIAADGDVLSMKITWDKALFPGMGSPAIKQAILSFVKGYASQKDRHRDMGFLGTPQFCAFDEVACIATVEARSSEARNFVKTVSQTSDEFNNYGH